VITNNELLDNNTTPEIVIRQVDYDWLLQNSKKIDELALLQKEPTPFASSSWLEAWWNVFSTNHQLLLLVVVNNDELVGFLPFMKTNVARVFTVLECLASGRSDHAPLLCKKGYEDAVFSNASRFLRETYTNWDVISLRALQDTQKEMLDMYFNLRPSFKVNDDVSPTLKIEGSWDDYLMGKSKKHRGNIRRLIRNAESIDELEVSLLNNINNDLLKEVSEVERSSWKGTDGNLRISGSGYDFFMSALTEFSKKEMLELWTCRYKGQLVSYIITFSFAKSIYFYNGAYVANYKDLHIPIKVSPGTLLIALALKSAYDRNFINFDFLRGDEAYKAEWAKDWRDLYQYVAPNKGIKAYLSFIVLFRLRWWLREYPLAQKIWRFIQSN